MIHTLPVLVLAASALLAAQSQPTQETAEVSGRVVDSATKLPISGVHVVLFRMINGRAAGGSKIDKMDSQTGPQDPAGAVFSALTGDDGRFSFSVTAPARLQLFLRREGYVPGGNGLMIRAKPGTTSRLADFTLDRPVTISGHVVDASTDKPLSGFSVAAKRWVVNGGFHELTPEGRPVNTDKDGAYELRPLPPGDYVLEIRPNLFSGFEAAGTADEFRDGAQPAYLRSFYPGVDRPEQAQKVLLLPGATQDRVDIKLSQQRAAAIRGCIHSELTPEELGPVELSLHSFEQQGFSWDSAVVASKTARSGDCFRLEGISPGDYWLSASNAKVAGEEARFAYASLHLEDQRVDNLVLEMRKPTAVRGKVVFPEQTQAGGEKAEPLKVFLEELERKTSEPKADAVEVAPSGSFTLHRVLEGSYVVHLTRLKPGLALNEVCYNGTCDSSDAFTLQPGAPSHRLELILAPATASLQVHIEDGTKSAGWEVALLRESGEQSEVPGLSASNTIADDDGRATFEGLLAGKYRVAAFPTNMPWRNDPLLSRQLTSGQTVEIATGATVSVEVKRTSMR
jgi:hypothetical protein